MALLDGKKLAEKILGEIKAELKETGVTPRLAIIVVGKDPVVEKFISQKKKTAESVGIEIRIYPFPEEITTNELRKQISEIVHEEKNDGVIIQLPLPGQINAQYILNSVTQEKDIDMLSSRALGNFIVGKSPIMPPVAGAIKSLFEEYGISLAGKHIVVAGAGSLVGRPVSLWLLGEKATFSVITKSSPNAAELILQADVIISGTGAPKFLTGDMVKNGVIIADAGTSESEGKLSGDVDLDSVLEKASFVSPVPGGVGPVTVAVLLRNLVTLTNLQK